MRPAASNRGFTLVELIVSMSLGTVVMLAVFSTYLYLGHNLTRLSYRSLMENQSRRILNTFASDIRNTKSIRSASAITLTLNIYNQDPATKSTTPTLDVTYAYDSTNKALTRDPDGSGPAPPVALNANIGEGSVQVPVTLLLPANGRLFGYATTTGDLYTTAGTGPTYQSTTTLVPMSIKQVGLSFTLQAGDPAVQGQQGTFSSYQVSSNLLLLINHPLPDGS